MQLRRRSSSTIRSDVFAIRQPQNTSSPARQRATARERSCGSAGNGGRLAPIKPGGLVTGSNRRREEGGWIYARNGQTIIRRARPGATLHINLSNPPQVPRCDSGGGFLLPSNVSNHEVVSQNHRLKDFRTTWITHSSKAFPGW